MTRTDGALDSTLLNDAVATRDTVAQLVSMIRLVRKATEAASEVPVSGHTQPDKPACARKELVTGLVNDALGMLATVEDIDVDQAQLVGLLTLVAGQDVEPDGGDRPGASARAW